MGSRSLSSLYVLVLVASCGLAPTLQSQSCYVPNFNSVWPMAMCDRAQGPVCDQERAVYSTLSACCSTEYQNLDTPYGPEPVELEDGAGICGTAPNTAAPPLSCFSSHEECACWVPDLGSSDCVQAYDGECFKGYGVFESKASCCAELMYESGAFSPTEGSCASICKPDEHGNWDCSGESDAQAGWDNSGRWSASRYDSAEGVRTQYASTGWNAANRGGDEHVYNDGHLSYGAYDSTGRARYDTTNRGGERVYNDGGWSYPARDSSGRAQSDATQRADGPQQWYNNDRLSSNGYDSSGSAQPDSANQQDDVVMREKKLPACKINGTVIELKPPVLKKVETTQRVAHDEHDDHIGCDTHFDASADPEVLNAGKRSSGMRSMDVVPDVVEIDIYFNIIESPNDDDSFAKVTRKQVEDTVKLINKKYYSKTLEQGFKFVLKGIYRWTSEEAAFGWTGLGLNTQLYEQGSEDQAYAEELCKQSWKAHMRKVVLGDDYERRDVVMAYIVDYQYTGGLLGRATFPFYMINQKTQAIDKAGLFVDGFEGDPSSLEGYDHKRPHVPGTEGSAAIVAHELGHWLGLFHVFEDGIDLQMLNATAPGMVPTSCKFEFDPEKMQSDPAYASRAYGNRCCSLNDLVSDTPVVLMRKNLHKNGTFNCDKTGCDCKSEVFSCEGPQPDMLDNIMDYALACMRGGQFTVGQMLRMREQYIMYRAMVE